MGHLRLADVKRLAKIANGIDPCEDCLYGKQTKKHSRIPHRQDPTRRETVKGARLHSDLAGGGNIEQTMGEHTYCVSFIDYTTDRCWIYMLKRKSEVPSICRKHSAMLETQGHPVKFYKSDNERIFAGQGTQDLCKEKGSLCEPSAPYSPNQNAVAERTFRTLFGRVRANLNDGGMPQSF